jgi:hypothetical protein
MREGAYAARILPDGRELAVYPLTFGRARLLLSATAWDEGALDAW